MPTLVELPESFSINRWLRTTYKTSKLFAPSKDGMGPLIPQFLKLNLRSVGIEPQASGIVALLAN
jgi:hypothetical protein